MNQINLGLDKGYKQTELGLLPEDWDCLKVPNTTLSSSNSIKIGPFGSALKKEYLTKHGYKVYGQENVYEKDMSIGDRYLGPDRFKELKSCEITSGDFLVSMMGTVGKCMIVPKRIEAGIMDSHLLRIKFNTSIIDPCLVGQLFETKIVLNQIKQLSVGGIMEGLSSKIIKSIYLPLPRKKLEQTAIATVLSDTDALIENLEKLIDKKRYIKQGTMQQLLTGKKRLPGFNGEWEVKKLGEICHYQNGTSLEKFFNNENGLKVISIGNYSPSGKFVVTDTFIDRLFERAVKKYILNKNELTMILNDKTSVGTIIGRVLLIEEDNMYVFNQRTMRLKPEKNILPKFLYQKINNDEIHNKLVSLAKPGTQIYVNTNDVVDLEILIPKTIEEQTAITTVLTDMDEEIENLEHKRDKYVMIKQGMMQQLLTGKIRIYANN